MNKMDKEVRRAARDLGAEVTKHKGLGTLEPADLNTVRKAAQYMKYLHYMEEESKAEFLDWLNAQILSLSDRRRLYGACEAIVKRFERLVKERGIGDEERHRLHAQLIKCDSTQAAENWLREQFPPVTNGKQVQEQQHRDFLERARLAALSNCNSSAAADNPAASAEEIEIEYHRERASHVRCRRGKVLYRQGLSAQGRRAKIRLFQEAFHEEVLHARKMASKKVHEVGEASAHG